MAGLRAAAGWKRNLDDPCGFAPPLEGSSRCFPTGVSDDEQPFTIKSDLRRLRKIGSWPQLVKIDLAPADDDRQHLPRQRAVIRAEVAVAAAQKSIDTSKGPAV